MRSVRRLLPALLALLASGCGRDFVGAPKQPGTDGFRAHAVVKKDGKTLQEFELAVRGNLRRKEQGSTVMLWDGDARSATIVEGGTARPRPFTTLDEALEGHPLTPGFSEKEEAARRHLESYHRESDGVLAGHVCWIWRFEDRYDEPGSPATTYWVAPDLHRMVLRVEHETPGTPEPSVLVTELTNVRIGAEPELFAVAAKGKR
jgi:hypothetical protein